MNEMDYKAYIVTEGEFDAQILNQLLPDLTDHPDAVNVLAARGYSSALAIVRSVLTQKAQPTLLIVDADTNDPMRIKEKRAFIEEYVKTNGLTCSIIVAVPTLEALFFSDKKTLEAALKKPISDEVWQLAQLSPKEALNFIAGDRQTSATRLLNNKQVRRTIEQSPIASEIRNFLQAA